LKIPGLKLKLKNGFFEPLFFLLGKKILHFAALRFFRFAPALKGGGKHKLKNPLRF
jgi:hypothetical protein